MHKSYRRYVPKLTALFIFLIGMALAVPAAGQDIGSINFETLESSDLSDQQLRQLWQRAQSRGYTLQELKNIALMRGMAPVEVNKLVRRVRNLEPRDEEAEIEQRMREGRQVTQDSLLGPPPKAQQEGESRIFGAKLFNNQENISFAPPLDIPTPASYQLGTGDQLIVDIWGATEQTYRLKISTEGTVMLPRVGPIYLNGLTIEEARVRLKNELEEIYASLKKGRSEVRITLGNIRSIQVTVLGNVAVPGTYTVPSLTSAFNVLYIAGGPDSTGTYRNIKIIRNGKVAATLDVYNFLVGGPQNPDPILLRDQDIIKVGPYMMRVELTGRTKRTGIFELKPGETIGDLIRYAGGFDTGAYTKSITVVRETPSHLKYINIQYPEQKGFVLQSGDSVHVGRISQRVTNRVTIQGAVFREGAYALRDTTTVYSLIQRAGGLRDFAFMNRGLIYRERDNMTTKVISFSPRKVMSNPRKNDINLQEDDVVVINSIFKMRDEYTIKISGAVQDPGTYPYVYNMTLEEAILQADGFDQSAAPYRVDVARRITRDSMGYVPSDIVKTFTFSVSENLQLGPRGANFELQPYDQIFVRSSPAYYEQQNVTIKGQVVYPGKYVLPEQVTRISDLIEMAGGLTRFAYPQGATLIRMIKQQRQIDTTLVNIGDTLQAGQQLFQKRYHVGINLAKIMNNPGSKYDLILQEGDVLKIPKKLQTVRITGEVLRPVMVRYTDDRSFKEYIRAAGGPTNDGDVEDAYIVYANGSVDRASSFLFFRNFPEVKPGATIYVPPEEEQKGLSTVQTVSLFSTILTTLAIVYNVIQN